jgi:hypothetical protein
MWKITRCWIVFAWCDFTTQNAPEFSQVTITLVVYRNFYFGTTFIINDTTDL